MTCHWRWTSPGLGLYVRTEIAFVVSGRIGSFSPAGREA